MALLRPSVDVRPVTEIPLPHLGHPATGPETKRPVILTQHGRSAAVLLDVGAYEALLEEVAVIRVMSARRRHSSTPAWDIPHEASRSVLRERYLK